MDRIPLGLNSYCLRGFKWPDLKMLEYAASLKLDGVYLLDSPDPATNDPAHWKAVKEETARLGLRLETNMGPSLPKTADGFDASVQLLRNAIRRAQGMGSPLVRTLLAGDRASLPPVAIEQNLENMVKVLRAVRSQALDAGLKIALENHKDLTCHEMRQVIEMAGKDFVGSHLDTGNAVYVMEDPLETVETLAPLALTLHLSDSVVYETPRGAAVQWVPLGEGVVDFPKIVARAKELCPPLYAYVKPITGRPPAQLPYFEPDFWKTYGNLKASSVARFMALARKGQPYGKDMVIEDVAGRNTIEPFAAALQYQQREHMERSLDYAKKVLDLGVHWRN